MAKFVIEIDLDHPDYKYNTFTNVATNLLEVVTKLHMGVPEYTIFSPHAKDKTGVFKIVEDADA